jgi:hypothetical protein
LGVVARDGEGANYVCALAPITFIKYGFSENFLDILLKFEVRAVVYQDFGEEMYKIKKDLLEELVRRKVSSHFNYDRISLWDIWYATVT